ncbi:hypothetical protein HYV70_04480 [Candidatus Uhrbacteria bacterium]|nr:hypothetical protein [Candidatus Uhrbacteria bacterium]
MSTFHIDFETMIRFKDIFQRVGMTYGEFLRFCVCLEEFLFVIRGEGIVCANTLDNQGFHRPFTPELIAMWNETMGFDGRNRNVPVHFSLQEAGTLEKRFLEAGYSLMEIEKLLEQMEGIIQVVHGAGIQRRKIVLDPSCVCLPCPRRRHAWSIQENTASRRLEIDPSKVGLHFSQNQLQGRAIRGFDLIAECQKEGRQLLGAAVLDYYLKYPVLIPSVFRDYSGEIYFLDTIFKRKGALYVRSLRRQRDLPGDCWESRESWLGHFWREKRATAIFLP